MSDEISKYKHSKRLHKDEVNIKKQTKIAKSYGIEVGEPHKLAKKHALNCGNPKCLMCSNPRKTWKEKTIQEKRNEQLDLNEIYEMYEYEMAQRTTNQPNP
jgi:hypothetical protein